MRKTTYVLAVYYMLVYPEIFGGHDALLQGQLRMLERINIFSVFIF